MTRAAAMNVQVSRPGFESHPYGGFETVSQFLDAVAAAATRGVIDPRLKPLAAAGGDEHGGQSDPAGGFLIPSSSSPFVAAMGAGSDPSAGRTLPVPMSTSTVSVNARVDKNHATSVSGGLTVSRIAETVAGSPSRGEYEQINLVAHEAFGLTFGTNRLVRGSFPAFTAVLSEAFRDEFGFMFFEERIRGTGVAAFQGILGSGALIAVAKETGQAADTIVGENIVKMRARCWGYESPSTVWVTTHAAMPAIQKAAIAVGIGESVLPLWTPVWTPGTDGHPDYLCGRPLYTSEAASSLGDEGDLILVNWSQYLDGTYQGMEMLGSIHVRYLERESAFAFNVLNDGAPWWRTSLSPRRSSTTLSPYITLAARA